MVQNDLRINHAWGAIDCGLAINPNHIRSQMEGGFIDGLNAAMFNDVRIEQGRVTTNNFDTLRWMRLADAPRQIDVEVLKGDQKPTGVGEPPTPPAAAALANAIFAATGKRLRSMPFAQALRG
jgi:isoquinoline 1-oxidoreductase beta subunit